MFYLTKTRGAYLGLFVGVVILALGVILKTSGKKRRLVTSCLILFLMLSSGLFLVQKDRILESVGGRIVSWEISWNAFKERPLLGWGPENYILAFAKHYQPEFSDVEKNWFDKAHNILWEYAVGAGILGLLSFLSVLYFAVKKSFFSASVLVAFFSANLFWLETTSVLVLLYVMLAWTEVDEDGPLSI